MIDALTPKSPPVDFRKSRRERLSLVDPVKLDRLPPHSIEAEQGVLGCVLLSPVDCIGECVEKFKAGKEVFYDLRHQEIFQAMVGMVEAKKSIDLITLQSWLKNKNQVEEVGGIAYLSSLPDAVPSAANLAYYAEIVFEKYVLRKMIQTCGDIMARAYSHEGEVFSLLDQVEANIMRLGESRSTESIKRLGEYLPETEAAIEDYAKYKGVRRGLTTGFHKLDSTLISGICGPKAIVIAARPSEGKTALGMNILEHIAIDTKKPVGLFSLEMGASELTMRMICGRARVNFRDVADGDLKPKDFKALSESAMQIRKAPIFIDDTGGLSILQIKAKARRMVQRHNVELIMIDYLQLISGSKKRGDNNRQQEISDISNAIKGLAKELNIPVLLLAQLNRAIEKEKGRRPRLSDLRESGAIEQDADIVLMPYNPKPPEDEEEESDTVDMVIWVAKQRGGPRHRSIPLVFEKRYTRFENPKPKDEEE